MAHAAAESDDGVSIPEDADERLREDFGVVTRSRTYTRCSTVSHANLARARTNSFRRLSLEHDGIVFMDVSELDTSLLGDTFHLKGFAARINYDDDNTIMEADSLMNLVLHHSFETLVWDGDSFQDDSFTKLIPDIYREQKTQLVMFLRNLPEDKERVEKSWGALKLPIVCFLCDPDIGFQELGAEALRATQSKVVICFGGGAVVDEEIQAGSSDVSYYYFGTRRLKAGEPEKYESSAIEHHVLSVPSQNEKRGSLVMNGHRPALNRLASVPTRSRNSFSSFAHESMF
eukprot:TRINITY_DN31208_c0_g1_i1.p1 TRINITY_DN31208_c0_g1~~TRINITY_DN31208_c0_g1_i1.p1  ORF type:complete len:315 (-),score=31.83 TRINITY_DN31208_c0_g1_i1:435-1298(-)